MKSIQDIKWAFFSYGHNLGDFTRALEVALGVKTTGAQVKFFNHGGIHNHMIAEAGIEEENLYPELSWEQHRVIMDINRYKAKVGTPLPVSKDEWIKMAEADLEAFARYKPDGVYAGLNLSCMISVPYAKLPAVSLMPTVNCPAFIEAEMYNMPNTMERNIFTRYILPGFIKRKIMKKVLLGDSAKASLTTFNEARAHFGLKPVYNIIELVKGDITLLPDLPILSGLPKEKLTKGYYYTAPVFSHMKKELPEKAVSVFSRKGLNIFCSLGSSGFPESLKFIVKTLRSMENVNIVCATTSILSPEELGPESENFYACEYLPAVQVNEMADIAILHGGQGTIQTAVWAGTPVIGIGFQAEQQANIDGIAREGTAVRIPVFALSEKRLKKAIATVDSPAYYDNAKRLQSIIRQTDGVAATAETMNKFILGTL